MRMIVLVAPYGAPINQYLVNTELLRESRTLPVSDHLEARGLFSLQLRHRHVDNGLFLNEPMQLPLP
jgi:hypothetical protein